MNRPDAIARDHTGSYYAASLNDTAPFTPLRDTHDTDVCVIGAGFTGISTALHLAEKGYRVHVVEANRIGWGASGRNGGQLCTGLRKDQITLERMLGRDDAHRLWSLAEEAKAVVRERVARHDIDCELKPGLLHGGHRVDDAEEMMRDADYLRREYDYDDIRPVSRAEMADMLGTDQYCGGNLDMGAGHIHPLNYTLGLARAAAASGR